MWEVTYIGISDVNWNILVPVDPCWQFVKNMQNCSWISFYEWINHIPKRQFTLTFNILQAFSDDSDKPLFQAMPLSQIIVLCFSVTLWKKWNTWVGKAAHYVDCGWKMNNDRRARLNINRLQHWLPFCFKMLAVQPRFVSLPSSKRKFFHLNDILRFIT